VSSPKEICWGQPFIAENKTKEIERKSEDAPRNTHRI
jgi:hypothetical protein